MKKNVENKTQTHELRCTLSNSDTKVLPTKGQSEQFFFFTWTPLSQFFPEDIDASLCTHLVFAFAKMGNSNQGWTLEPYEWNDQDTDWSEVFILLD